jgi:hypothetical protein
MRPVVPQVTFMCLTNMPKAVREGLHFSSCKHIHSLMMETLLHKVRRSLLALASTHVLSSFHDALADGRRLPLADTEGLTSTPFPPLRLGRSRL